MKRIRVLDFYQTAKEAVKAGYVPRKVCNPPSKDERSTQEKAPPW